MPIVLLGPATMRIEGLDLPLPFRVETSNDFPPPRVGPCPVLVYLGDSNARPMQGTYYAADLTLADVIDESGGDTKKTTYQGTFRDRYDGRGTVVTTFRNGESKTRNWTVTPK